MINRVAALGMVLSSLLLAGPVGAQVQPSLIGRSWTYQVRHGDTLARIAARSHVPARHIRLINGLKRGERLRSGQRLILSNLHIVPAANGARVVVNIPELQLYCFQSSQSVECFPVSLGQPFDPSPKKDPKRWQTPVGTFKIVEKRADPVWTVPKSIQAEMAARGEEVKEKIDPGPDNPLGHYYIGLSLWGYGIHGTIAPSSVGSFKTHGCIRLKPGAIDRVFQHVSIGNTVRIAYDPVKVATRGSDIYIEVTSDAYRRSPPLMALAVDRLKAAGVYDRVDPDKLARAVQNQGGIAVRIERPINPPGVEGAASRRQALAR